MSTRHAARPHAVHACDACRAALATASHSEFRDAFEHAFVGRCVSSSSSPPGTEGDGRFVTVDVGTRCVYDAAAQRNAATKEQEEEEEEEEEKEEDTLGVVYPKSKSRRAACFAPFADAGASLLPLWRATDRHEKYVRASNVLELYALFRFTRDVSLRCAVPMRTPNTPRTWALLHDIWAVYGNVRRGFSVDDTTFILPDSEEVTVWDGVTEEEAFATGIVQPSYVGHHMIVAYWYDSDRARATVRAYNRRGLPLPRTTLAHVRRAVAATCWPSCVFECVMDRYGHLRIVDLLRCQDVTLLGTRPMRERLTIAESYVAAFSDRHDATASLIFNCTVLHTPDDVRKLERAYQRDMITGTVTAEGVYVYKPNGRRLEFNFNTFRVDVFHRGGGVAKLCTAGEIVESPRRRAVIHRTAAYAWLMIACVVVMDELTYVRFVAFDRKTCEYVEMFKKRAYGPLEWDARFVCAKRIAIGDHKYKWSPAIIRFNVLDGSNGPADVVSIEQRYDRTMLDCLTLQDIAA